MSILCKELDYKRIELPIVEKVTKEIFALDIFPGLTKQVLDKFIDIMTKLGHN